MRKTTQTLTAVVALFLAPPLSLAHHSFAAEYIADKSVTVQGVITKVQWINPHVYVNVDARDDAGNVTVWTFETLPTGFLHKAGITRDLLRGQPGDIVTVLANPAKDGTKGRGWIMKITYPDGHFYNLAEKHE